MTLEAVIGSAQNAQRDRQPIQGEVAQRRVAHIIFTVDVLTYQERITALTFLYGNLWDTAVVSLHRCAAAAWPDLAPMLSMTTTRGAHRPASLSACCSRGIANVCMCDAVTHAGRCWPSSACLDSCSTVRARSCKIVVWYMVYNPVV